MPALASSGPRLIPSSERISRPATKMITKNAHAAGHCGQRPDLLGAETWWDFADMQRDNLGREGPEYADQHQRYDHDYQDLRDVVTEENNGVFPPISQQCGKIPAFGHS